MLKDDQEKSERQFIPHADGMKVIYGKLQDVSLDCDYYGTVAL
jgi:hypothetical protein